MEKLYQKVYITDCVFLECTEGEFQDQGIENEIKRIREAAFLEICPQVNTEIYLAFSKLVDEGEASAIALALEIKGGLLLLDDREARELAEIYKLRYVGTIGILLRAREIGLIDEPLPGLLDNLKSTGFYLSSKLENRILRSYK